MGCLYDDRREEASYDDRREEASYDDPFHLNIGVIFFIELNMI